MEKLNISNKNTGEPLEAVEFNALKNKTNEIIEQLNQGGGGNTPIDTSGIISISNKGNVTLGSGKNVNIEPAWNNNILGYTGNLGDIALKPGDDILLCSHHREFKKRDKIVIKNIDGSDNPVKMEVVAGEINLAVGTSSNPKTATKKKDKTTGADTVDPMFKSGDAKTMDIRILTGNTLDAGTEDEREERGYLKIRALAIDLRCEKHGGIALQPKGYDDEGYMNKIKFEHGGGDGLEFGTFNSEKTSIFTDEYRFNKNGIWKMATRIKEASNKDIIDERDGGLKGLPATAAEHYIKNPEDDFYDFISPDDEQATTNSIIKTAYALNDGKNRHAKYSEKITSKGELKKILEIETVITITYEEVLNPSSVYNTTFNIPQEISDVTKIYTLSDFKDAIKTLIVDNIAQKYGKSGEEGVTLSEGDIITINEHYYKIVENFAPSMEITSNADLSIKGKEKLELGGGIVEFGADSIDLGEMEDGLYAQYKLTKKNNSKPCDTLKIKVINNNTTPLVFDADSANFSIDSFYPGLDLEHPAVVTVPEKIAEPSTEAEAKQHIQVVAQCKLFDVIKFVTWAKANNFGPWSNDQI